MGAVSFYSYSYSYSYNNLALLIFLFLFFLIFLLHKKITQGLIFFTLAHASPIFFYNKKKNRVAWRKLALRSYARGGEKLKKWGPNFF
jgi:hypothetical protein